MANNKNINTPANMTKRLICGIGIVALVVGFFLLRQISENTIYLFDVLVGFLMIAGSFEIESLFKKMNRQVFSVALAIYPVINFVMLLIALIFKFGVLYYLLLNILVLLFIFILIYTISILNKKAALKQMYLTNYEGGRLGFALKKSANTVLGMLYPTLLLMFVFMINHFSTFMDIITFDVGLLGLVMLFATTMTADTMAFLIGRTIKTKKISIEKLGPGKTWSGLVGGILGAIIAAIVVYVIFFNCGYKASFDLYHLNIWSFIVIGLFCGIFNMAGDVLASYLKRRAGVKDFSNLIPGHGGVMDRINGLVVNAVCVFVCLMCCF